MKKNVKKKEEIKFLNEVKLTLFIQKMKDNEVMIILWLMRMVNFLFFFAFSIENIFLRSGAFNYKS